MAADLGEPEYWITKWAEGKSRWHANDINPWLVENFAKMTKEQKGLTIFVPFSGKSVDMTWFVSQGHRVVGCEVAKQAVAEYMADIPHTVSPIDGCDGQLYKSDDGKYTFYNCNYFDLTPTIIGKFDAIWDRGSLMALPDMKWEEYYKVIFPLMTPGCRYLLEWADTNEDEAPRPPFPIGEERLKEIYSQCDVEFLNREDSPFKREYYGISKFDLCRHLITPKQS